MEDDLQLSDNRYSVALLIFFVGYLLGEVIVPALCVGFPTERRQIPSNMMLSRSRPSIYLPTIVCTWGVVAGLFSTIQSYKGLVVARFFLVRAQPFGHPAVTNLGNASVQGCIEVRNSSVPNHSDNVCAASRVDFSLGTSFVPPASRLTPSAASCSSYRVGV